jgi:hypothetical protein
VDERGKEVRENRRTTRVPGGDCPSSQQGIQLGGDTMRLVIAICITLLTAVAWGDTQLSVDVSDGAPPDVPAWEPSKEAVVKWTQLPDLEGAAYTSSYRTADGYWAESADDFLCDAGDPIVAIEWWGVDSSAGEIAEFVVRFYADVPGPPFSHPGDLLYEVSIVVFTAELIPGIDNAYHYTADLPMAFEQEAGNIYWISIMGVLESVQWFWWECVAEDYWNDEGVIRSDFWGVPDWTPWSDFGANYIEFAFVLYADVTNPVEDATWGGIKALFR